MKTSANINFSSPGMKSLSVCAALIFITSLSLSAQQEIQRKGEAHIKIGLNAYSFSKLLNDPIKGRGEGISLFDLLDFCAEHNIDAIDPTGYFFPGYPGVPTDEYINAFKRRAHHLGIDISGTGVRNNFASPDPAARAADVQHVKEWIEVAAKLGAPVLRVFAGKVPEGYEDRWDEVAGWMAESLKECTEHAAKFGVIIGVQNHGDMLKTAEQCIKLVKMVDSEWIGIILDTGYFMTEDPYVDMEMVIPYTVNWQVKESAFGKESDIRIDLERLMKIIKRSGYRGYIPIETLSISGRPYDPFTLVPAFLEEVREAMNAEFK